MYLCAPTIVWAKRIPTHYSQVERSHKTKGIGTWTLCYGNTASIPIDRGSISNKRVLFPIVKKAFNRGDQKKLPPGICLKISSANGGEIEHAVGGSCGKRFRLREGKPCFWALIVYATPIGFCFCFPYDRDVCVKGWGIRVVSMGEVRPIGLACSGFLGQLC